MQAMDDPSANARHPIRNRDVLHPFELRSHCVTCWKCKRINFLGMEPTNDIQPISLCLHMQRPGNVVRASIACQRQRKPFHLLTKLLPFPPTSPSFQSTRCKPSTVNFHPALREVLQVC